MQHLTQLNGNGNRMPAVQYISTMKTIVERLTVSPLNVTSYSHELFELSMGAGIDELRILLPELQRSLRERASYKGAGYDMNVEQHAKQVKEVLLASILADKGIEQHRDRLELLEKLSAAKPADSSDETY